MILATNLNSENFKGEGRKIYKVKLMIDNEKCVLNDFSVAPYCNRATIDTHIWKIYEINKDVYLN